jgi:hypothetical protein
MMLGELATHNTAFHQPRCQSATIFWPSCEHRPQKLQLPHQPPRHEKNADIDPDGEQHFDHCTTHPVEPAAAAIMIKVLLI